MRRYKDEMTRARDPRMRSRFYISFYDCEDTSSNGIARFFAMAIDPSNRSARMTADGLVSFLRYQRKALGGPLDLLLDEVDLICEDYAFKFLGDAAKLGLCRLVLCGRGVLLKTMLSAKSPLECRLELIQLEPLDENSARELIFTPLADLGFTIIEPDRVGDQVLRLTGRLPNLLQFYGQKLVELVLDKETDTISPQHVEKIKGDFVTAQYFIKPLNDLEDPETRLVGLSLLKEDYKEFSVTTVMAVADRAGLSLEHKRALEICNDLVINNVLAWNDGSFRIANEGLYFYAHKMGYLDGALKEAHRAIKSRY
ncbi:MAG: hypothetical protein L0229_25175 [Blastocatellia bacterium]|nr:hypothetical protein [Blastocatellia bacterium]